MCTREILAYSCLLGRRELCLRCHPSSPLDGLVHTSGGDGQDDNPFDWDVVCKNIEDGLRKDGFKRGAEYEIMLVPNVVNITYGRGVGYSFEEEDFDKSVTDISATNIRKKMRDEGKL